MNMENFFTTRVIQDDRLVSSALTCLKGYACQWWQQLQYQHIGQCLKTCNQLGGDETAYEQQLHTS